MSGSNQHRVDDLGTPIRDQGGDYEVINVGEDCWIGNGGLVMASVGEKTIVGAGSVVTQDLPPYVIAVGNPARIVRSRLETPDAASPNAPKDDVG